MGLKLKILNLIFITHFCAVRPSCHCQWAKATWPADSRAWHCQSAAEDSPRGALLCQNPQILDPFPDLCLFLIFDIVLQEEQHGGPHGGAGGGRAERLAEELDDMERRVEQAGSQFHFSIFITTLLIIYLTPIIKCWSSIIAIVYQARDTLATDMMSFVAKDADLAGLIAK